MAKRAISVLAAGILTVVGTAILTPGANAATNLLANGSFESGLTSWSTTGTVTAAAASANATADTFSGTGSPDLPGTQDITFTTGAATITQAISLVAGTVYRIGYDASSFGTVAGTTASLSVTLNGVALSGLSITQALLGTANSWVEQIITYKAPTTVGVANLVISYNGGATPTKIAADRAFVSNIPEPSSAILLAGAAFGLWRKRRQSL